jgi:ABC-type dipeptide/oligopeptide/nickel transport system ATPase subunit
MWYRHVVALVDAVELGAKYNDGVPSELSGGQR